MDTIIGILISVMAAACWGLYLKVIWDERRRKKMEKIVTTGVIAAFENKKKRTIRPIIKFKYEGKECTCSAREVPVNMFQVNAPVTISYYKENMNRYDAFPGTDRITGLVTIESDQILYGFEGKQKGLKKMMLMLSMIITLFAVAVFTGYAH